ncbi:MAG: hypothetical protein Q8914_04080 [Bacteroidota bacterium]|nr:hypothetical protein [Bacteroidota bacterium]
MVNRVYEENLLDNIRKYEQGAIFGTGMSYHHYSFEFRYELGNGISSYSALGSFAHRFQFLLAYTF